MSLRTSTIRGGMADDLQSRELELATAHDVWRELVTDGTSKVLNVGQGALGVAAGTEHHQGSLLDLEPGTRDGGALGGQIEREAERLGDHARERAYADVQCVDMDVAQPLCLFAGRLDQAHGDGELVHARCAHWLVNGTIRCPRPRSADTAKVALAAFYIAVPIPTGGDYQRW